MLSDESSSDSETGRFKGQTKTEEEKVSNRKQESFRSGRHRASENNRFHRDFDRRRDDYDKHSRDRHRFSRHSPVRKRHSRDRSPRRSHERYRHRDARAISKTKEPRSRSRDRQKRSRSRKSSELKPRSHKSPEIKIRSHRTPEPKSRPVRPVSPRREVKDEIKRIVEPSTRSSPKIDRKSPRHEKRPSPKHERRSRERLSSSPDIKTKRSAIYIPPVIVAPLKRKSESPIVVEVKSDSEKSEEVQLGSYYNMIPAVVKEKSEVSSEIDSSDDERLRAKLLNLEKELQKTRKKKHKRKHKRKSLKSSKEREVETIVVEVSSTTDIQDKVKEDSSQSQVDAVPEVSSTQKGNKKESSEEGEILSDDDSQIEYDPSDLRHKLRQSKQEVANPGVCGPALPPHLKGQRQNSAQGTEGPALPPHLHSRSKSKNIGPSITEDLRKVLAEREVIKYESSDEDGIGPLPVGLEEKWSEAHQRLEERALDIKIKSLDGHSLSNQKIKSREEWMLELPEGKAKYLGLEARGFRPKAGPDMTDRSSWTDTPEEKARKAAGIVKEEDADVMMRREARARLIATRDEEQEMSIKKHKKKHKREESLLELHQKKLKKKKKKEEKETEGKKERRPFSRDVDLQVNRFDEAQKKSIIKKAQDLNSRFGRGEAKYL